MGDRPILRLPKPSSAARLTGKSKGRPRPSGPGQAVQKERFQDTFNRLSKAMTDMIEQISLRDDPAGIAPERALVFVTAGMISGFARAAKKVGLEVFTEAEIEPIEAFPEGFKPTKDGAPLERTLYATIPNMKVFNQILTLWKAYSKGEKPKHGLTPWWKVFDCLIDLRTWGPADRLNVQTIEAILDRLPTDDHAEVCIEIEIWPTKSEHKRLQWVTETEAKINDFGGRVIDRSSLNFDGFSYEALLSGLPAHIVRNMIQTPSEFEGLATLEGIQFILPQMLGMTTPAAGAPAAVDQEADLPFDIQLPPRAALFDGTPIAAHKALDGGVYIEDIHDLIGRSQVSDRVHATAMASLILRGDLLQDGSPLNDARLVSVPLLVDQNGHASSPSERLFVDLLHVALTRLFDGNEPIAPSVFVINFSIGIQETRFAGQMSALARLIDWWSNRAGILFVISSGNIAEDIIIRDMTSTAFDDATEDQRTQAIQEAQNAQMAARTLLAPSEAINALTVGALSQDMAHNSVPHDQSIFSLSDAGQYLPQLTSALGPGLKRSIKPDLLAPGGEQEYRALPQGGDTIIRPVQAIGRKGLITAGPPINGIGTRKTAGTSSATALTTRSILQSASALTAEDGPYSGIELARYELALLTRALAVNSARWSAEANGLFQSELARLGPEQHARAKEHVIRHYGHGNLSPELMSSSPDSGVTLIGLGSLYKDKANDFVLPLPPSLSGERIPRSMRVTLAWFSPINAARAQYRLAGLEAIALDDEGTEQDKTWWLDLKSDGPDANMIKRGTVWSRRLVQNRDLVPPFADRAVIPIRVQCRDAASDGLPKDSEIHFAIAVTLEVEVDVQFDIYAEINNELRLRTSGQA